MNFEKKNIWSSRLLLNLSDKRNLKRSDKYVTLSNLSIYCSWKNFKKLYKNNVFTISALTQNEKLKLPDESYSASSIQDYFEYIIKKHETVTDYPPIRIYVNNIEKENQIPETMKLLESTKIKITKDKTLEMCLI